jgi:hypothetical protein
MRHPLLALLGGLVLFAGTVAVAQSDQTTERAVWLLQKSTLVHADGMHNVLLRSLRQMQDPSLKPLFSALVQKHHPVLKIHGILGLAEISTPKKIDLALVADLKDPATQAQLVSSAMEADLLDTAQAKQLATWPGLDPAVKVIVAARLVADKALDNPKLLDDALAAENPALKGMAALLKLQLGDPKAMALLNELDASTQPNRDDVRKMLLGTAVRYKFDAVAPWALKIANEPSKDKQLTFIALRTALMFKAPEASDLWLRHFDSATDAAERIRLAMLGLDLAEKIAPKGLEPLAADKDELVQQMGVVAKLIAAHQPPQAAILKLVEQNNIMASKWALDWASDRPIEEATPVLLGLILTAEGEPNPVRFRAQRLESAVLATEMISEKAADAKAVLGSILSQAPQLTQEAMLMGLIRSTGPRPEACVEGVTLKSDTAEALALLLQAKHSPKLTPDQLDKLSLIVRGGAGLQDPLRVQAAWVYLRIVNQEKVALASVLGK